MVSARVTHPKGAKTVLARLKRMYGAPAKQPVEGEAIEQIVLAILAYNETTEKARIVLQKLKGYYVDFNELRVARSVELVRHMGPTFTQNLAKAKKILAVLKGIFGRENSFDLSFFKTKSKQDLEEYFKDIPGADNYVLSSVILCCCGRQAFPLDEKMLEACKDLELARGPVDLENMQAYLERQLRSADSYAFCQLLKKHALKETTQARDTKTTKKKAGVKKKKVKSSAEKKTPKTSKKKKSTKQSKTRSKSKK